MSWPKIARNRAALQAWLDFPLERAVHSNPQRSYAELSEFTYDLRHPSPDALARARPSFLERDPALFWKGVSLGLLVLLIVAALGKW